MTPLRSLYRGISCSQLGCALRCAVARDSRNIQAVCGDRPELAPRKSLASFSPLSGGRQDVATAASTPLATMSSTATSRKLASAADQKLVVEHDRGNQEFVIMLGEDKAYLQYSLAEDESVDLWTTEVPPAHRNKGVAKLLAQAALDHFAKTSTPMHISCTYLQKYVKDFPQPAHQKYIISD